MTAILVWVALGALAVFGAYGKFHAQWTEEGRAACQAAYAKADADLKAKGDVVVMDAKDHLADMEVAYEQGQKDAGVRVVTKIVRAEADAKSGAIPVCGLPPASLENLNAARLSMRRETASPQLPQAAGATIYQFPVPAPIPAAAAPPVPPAARQPLAKVVR